MGRRIHSVKKIGNAINYENYYLGQICDSVEDG
jgi:hypothetical protein